MSFGWTGMFRQGAWRDFRRFVLDQRRDVMARLTVINAELNRIGYIRVLYSRMETEGGGGRMTEARVGIDVTPDSSLGKLLQAYVAQGGNPFDISMFLTPDAVELVDSPDAPSQDDPETPPELRETQPYGGTASSQTTDPITGGLYTGGWLPLWRYPARRLGSSTSYLDRMSEVTRDVHAMRGWVVQEIRTLRNDLEARIIKLCDLREQLQKEANELIPQAVGGVIPGVNYATEQHAASHHVSAIADALDTVFYPLRPDGTFDFASPRTTAPNPAYPTLLDDAPGAEEDWTGLG